MWISFRAGKGSRTLDIDLGKVALYQLSYSRIVQNLTKRAFFVKGNRMLCLHKRLFGSGTKKKGGLGFFDLV